ncbi:hypothetical protein MUU77_17365 [Pseudoxanthomonas sp. F37]|uniref:hypothetical protein n=1 Tax=Pseudoxanthomonas sp. F37 TaxID=2932492 RepID=UPI001FD2273B|nr:hypothetical protein [Pseudoxanthomonas sp. F37]UOV08549.1 hypothetical protein MUU77_17365 [Pseudoxanthomonas sp. F37]
MSVSEAFTKAGIQRAIIVDDAYDPAPTKALQSASAQTVINDLDDTQYTDLLVLLQANVQLEEGAEIDGADQDQQLIAYLTSLDGTRILFAERARFAPAAERAFETYLDLQRTKLSDVELLKQRLETHGIAVETYGVDADLTGAADAQLLFLDLHLRDTAGGKVGVEDALEVYQKIERIHPQAQRFVFLMSTLEKTLEETAEPFRQKAKLFVSQFEPLKKSLIAKEIRLDELLRNYALTLLHLRGLRTAVVGFVDAIKQAADRMENAFLDLDIADYKVLQANTTGIEKVPLGVYVSELALEYLNYEVESDPRVWGLSNEIDRWNRDNLPRSRFALRPSVGKVYSGNVIHARERLSGEERAKRGPKDGYFYLGDVFFKTDDCKAGAVPKTAMVIATPACDLARPEVLVKDRTILLCEGKVSKLSTASPIPSLKGGIAPLVIPHPVDVGTQLEIGWEIKRLVTWGAKDIKSIRGRHSKWQRVGRLRPLYALQVQHAITADLSRIGTQRPPSELVPYGVELLVRNGEKWKSLDNVEAKSSISAAVYHAEKRFTFVISDPTVMRFRDEITALGQKTTDKKLKAAIRELEGLKNLDKRLVYCNADRSAKSIDDYSVYPLDDGKIKSAKRKYIAYADQRNKCLYRSVSGGANVVDGQEAYFVVRFTKLT